MLGTRECYGVDPSPCSQIKHPDNIMRKVHILIIFISILEVRYTSSITGKKLSLTVSSQNPN
jgi:hypothetical protein